MEEHRRRQGDPVAGGGTRKPIMTAYRQQALGCAAAMASAPQRPRDLKPAFPDAQKILRRNVYGWFERSGRGVYALTEAGRKRAGDMDWRTARLNRRLRRVRERRAAFTVLARMPVRTTHRFR